MQALSKILFGIGILALMAEPAAWLFKTWTQPGYDSDGALVAGLCLGLVLWSTQSGPATASAGDRRWAVALVLLAASIRLIGRLLDVHHIGALALVADVAALGLGLALHRRPKPVHPIALAGLFALSLPTQQLLQHVLGQPLRMGSAVVTAALLKPILPDLVREGALIRTAHTHLQIDLPCSGAQGLFLLAVSAWGLACVKQVGLRGAVQGTLAVTIGALMANVVRLCLLLLGPTEALLLEPAHSIVGLVGLALGMTPMLWIARHSLTRVPTPSPEQTPATAAPLWATASFAAIAIGAALAPAHPIDVSPALPHLALPHQLNGVLGEALALTDQERDYFERFGGHVERRSYRGDDHIPYAALIIATKTPVRHLHEAEDCLRGAGHEVHRLGIRATPFPTVIYKTVDPQGRTWRVQSTLISDRGEVAETASEVVWRWMADPTAAWMRVERVTPWSACEHDASSCDDFDVALFSALNLQPLDAT